MFSKVTFLFIIILNLIFAVGCGLKVGEKTQVVDVVEVKSAKCLNQAIKDLKVYFAGNASDAQVDSSVMCLQEVFVAFKENINGQDKKSYTAKEIATFVETNFLNDTDTHLTNTDTHFTDDFLNQLMKFKVILVGGTSEVILKQEIYLLADFLDRYKSDLVKLNPHMKILTLGWTQQLQPQDPDLKEKQFIEAKKQFYQFVQKLTADFALSAREYQIEDLIDFAIEIARFTKSSDSTIDTIKKSKNFLIKFKLYLIGGQTSLKGNEWQRLGLTLHEAFFQKLRIEYFLKNLADNQVDRKWQVYEKISLDMSSLIEKLLEAKESQAITNTEIYNLLQPLSQIIPEASVDEKLLNDLGEMKIMLLGGSSIGKSGWSKDDFYLLNKKIPTLFDSLSTLVQNVDFLSLNKNILFRSTITYDNFLETEKKILTAVDDLSNEVENSYDLSSFKNLLVDLSNGPFKSTMHLPENLDSLFNVAVAAKSTLTGRIGYLVIKEDLKLIMKSGIRFYINYAEYDLFLSPYQFQSTEFISNLMRLTLNVKATILFELNLKADHIIKSTDLTQLVLTLQNENFLNTEFKTDGLNQAFDAMWSHIFNIPEDRINDLYRSGLDQVIVDQLFVEIDIWINVQKNISIFFDRNSEWSADNLKSEILNQIGTATSSNNIEGLQEIKLMLDDQIPHTFNNKGYLQILMGGNQNYHFADLNYSNISRAVSRLLIRAYAKDIGRVNSLSGLFLEEAQFAYLQFKPLIVDLNLIDPANDTFIASRFREANLFLSNSNGDNLAQFQELHHLVLHILSGVARANDLKNQIVTICLPNQVDKVTAKTTVSEDCLLETYFNEVDSFLDLPQFIQMRIQFSKEENKSYYLSLLKAAGYIPNSSHMVQFSDADLFPHVVQYIEMVYARHDTSKDGFLQKDEALVAFPVFKDLLRELVKSYKQIKEDDLPGVFVYILKFGRPPRKESIAEVLKFVGFIRDKDQKDWNIQSTRLDLGKIFNYIADATKPAVPVPTPTPQPNSSPVTPADPNVGVSDPVPKTSS